MKFSLVIPCYNESENVPLIVERVGDRNSSVFELILVDNGSSDNTLKEINRMKKEVNYIKSVILETNQGYGGGILAGLQIATGEILGWSHADLQTDPGKVVDYLMESKELFDNYGNLLFLKGRRTKRRLFDNFFTVSMSLFESLILRKMLWDINAQPSIFHRTFFQSWINPPKDFSLDLYVLYLAKLKGFVIRRRKFVFNDRNYGTSSWNQGLISKIKFIKRTVKFSLTLKRGKIG